MILLDYAQQRLCSFLAEIERTFESDFPYNDSRLALESLQRHLQQRLDVLSRFTDQSAREVVAAECALALRDLTVYLPVVGFIVRSTAVRNAFEAFGPFKRLAAGLLVPASGAQRDVYLVSSSEWQYFAFIYNPIAQLEDFLLIGLPASESSNPLLLPLAGHELGHALWQRKNLTARFRQPVQDRIVDTFQKRMRDDDYAQLFSAASGSSPEEVESNIAIVESRRIATNWCLEQCQETFCDLVGLAIFGESYYHAFAYTLSPGTLPRSVRYPETSLRAGRLADAAPQFGLTVPVHFTECIEPDSAPQITPADRLLLKIADDVLELTSPDLLNEAKTLTAGVAPGRAGDGVPKILARLAQVAPSDGASHIADILNAAWAAYNDPELWKNFPEIQKKRADVLKEIVLKSLEIFEIEQILA